MIACNHACIDRHQSTQYFCIAFVPKTDSTNQQLTHNYHYTTTTTATMSSENNDGNNNNRKRQIEEVTAVDPESKQQLQLQNVPAASASALSASKAQSGGSKKQKSSHNNDYNNDNEEQETDETELLSALKDATKNSCNFRLEAIFLPKFDNERRTDQTIRNEITERVSAGKGFAEVTLKHSGSLLLWSGSQRFYSKNSANNQVTCVGEILLRQHFYRISTTLSPPPTSTKEAANGNVEWLYQQCSDYVEKHRLTLAFEVVTSVLGDHAAIPKRDFLILTAVADRSRQTGQFFYSTSELLQLAQTLHLPHNDTWVFSTKDSLKQLFDLYDSSRETGMADTIINALTKASEHQIVSIYPHDVFHSNILEGFVIRYVPYQDTSLTTDTTKISLEALSKTAKQLLKDVAPDLPPSFELPSTKKLPPVLSTNVRNIFKNASRKDKTEPKDESMTHNNDDDDDGKNAEQSTNVGDNHQSNESLTNTRATNFEKELREILKQSGLRVTLQRVSGSFSDILQTAFPSYCSELLLAAAKTSDKNGAAATKSETKEIAQVIQILHSLGERVRFSIFREEQEIGSQCEEGQQRRWLCMVHVYYDKTFQRFRKEQEKQQHADATIDLFRGFCIELVVKDKSVPNTGKDVQVEATGEGHNGHGISLVAAHDNDNTMDRKSNSNTLILKMKLIPYMVRTFGCRNGIRFVRQGGPERFNKYVRDLLTVHWQVSLEACQRWMPYLEAWGEYCHAALTGVATQKQRIKVLTSVPLSEDCYLEHLAHFETLYSETARANINSQSSFGDRREPTSHSLQSTSDEVFRGLVIVVASDAAEAEKAAEFISNKWLHQAKRLSGGTEAISHEGMLLYCTPGIGGRVCCGSVTAEKVRKVRMLPEVDKTFISVVLVGLTEDEVKASSLEEKEQRRLIGQTTAWRKSKCGAVVDLAREYFSSDSSSTDKTKDYEDAKSQIWKVSRSIPELENRPGLIVFFPASIPGCGKSTILDGDTESKLQETLSSIIKSASPESNSPSGMKLRKVSLLVGDQLKKKVKFWNQLKEERLLNSATVSVTDKNVPSPTWEKVGQICTSTNGRPVAVIPTRLGVLHTTHVEGARKPDGSYDADIKHLYPFTLNYLAVCMARVLERQAGSHPGGLDKQSAPFAMMVVVRFFSLYRGISAPNFLDTLNSRLAKGGAGATCTPIELPFFDKQSFQDLPEDLDQVLVEALRAQVRYHLSIFCVLFRTYITIKPPLSRLYTFMQRGWDIAKADIEKTTGEGDYTKELEAKLRNCIHKHRRLLLNMSVNEVSSRKILVSQVIQRVLEIDSLQSSSCEFIKIVSIDIPRANIHSLMRKHISIETDLLEGRLHKDAFVDGEYRISEYVSNTHITMAHFTQLPQTKMRAMFEPILGQQVLIQVKGILWSKQIAALEVSIPAKTVDGKTIPQHQNSFPHITIWHTEETAPSESNSLPQLLAAGEASQLEFSDQITLSGTISFWRFDRH